MYLLPLTIVRIACSAVASARCTRTRCIYMTAAADLRANKSRIFRNTLAAVRLLPVSAEPDTESATARRTHAFSERVDL